MEPTTSTVLWHGQRGRSAGATSTATEEPLNVVFLRRETDSPKGHFDWGEGGTIHSSTQGCKQIFLSGGQRGYDCICACGQECL